MNKTIFNGRQISTKDTPVIEFCKATSVIISNKSDGTIYYTFGSTRFELEKGESDPWESPNNPVEGRLEFSIPSAITSVNIKVKIVEIL